MPNQEYDNTNRGALFKNDDRKTDKHPEYTGVINVGGEEFWLSGWVNKSGKTGRSYFRLSVQPKERPPSRGSSRQAPPPEDDFDDDIPF